VSTPQLYPTSVDGEIHAPGEGMIACDDPGFLLGLAVYDTLLHERGCLYFQEQHLARLESGARALSIAWPLRWDLERELDRYCRELGARDCAVRITITRGVPGRGATLVIGARDILRAADPGVAVVLVPGAKLARDPLENVKCTSRVRNVLARERAMASGAFEALLCTHEGDVSEGTQSNVFAAVDGRVITPALERGALAGIMRAEVLAALRASGRDAIEDRLEPADLARASEVFLTSTTARVVPVLEVRDCVRGLPGARGELVRDLRRRIAVREDEYRRARESARRRD
jgi:branched-subunit amino acid aminotransferase/4-amino-4-deoxychorismate lyase